MRTFATVAGVVAIGFLAGGMLGVAEESKPAASASAPAGGGPTLLGMLSEWAYPEATWIGGPEMSDGGNPDLQSIKCKVVLTTPDSFEEVTKYYAKELATDKAGGGAAEKGAAKKGGRTVAVIDDCVFDEKDARPVKVQVITVNDRKSSTTLVISRADQERETHVVWSHFLRVGEK